MRERITIVAVILACAALGGCENVVEIQLPAPDSYALPTCDPPETIAAPGFATVELFCLNPPDGTDLVPAKLRDDGAIQFTQVRELAEYNNEVATERTLLLQNGVFTLIGEGDVFDESASGARVGSFPRYYEHQDGLFGGLHDAVPFPMVWRDGARITLPGLPDSGIGQAISIDAAGVIVGWAGRARLRDATTYFLPMGGSGYPIGYSGFHDPTPVRWIPAGDGWTIERFGGDSVYYSSSTPSLPSALQESYYTPGAPRPVSNNAGQVLIDGPDRSVVLTNGVAALVQSTDGKFLRAIAINSAGAVIGTRDMRDQVQTGTWSGNGDPYFVRVTHAFVWLNGQYTDLSTLGGASSSAAAISDSGTVIGFADTADPDPIYASYTYFNYLNHAFIYRDGVMHDLDEMLPPDAKLRIAALGNINSSGQILARVTRADANDVTTEYLAIITLPAE